MVYSLVSRKMLRWPLHDQPIYSLYGYKRYLSLIIMGGLLLRHLINSYSSVDLIYGLLAELWRVLMLVGYTESSTRNRNITENFIWKSA